MFLEILELFFESAEDAFLEVGVFVGAILLLFGYINYRKSGNFIKSIERSKRFQPILGALLGLTPGCGGAVFVMPLFFKGSVTFGTVVATLMATMGDSAFVLIPTSPYHYVLVSILSFIPAVITGYLVDKTSLGDFILRKYKEKLALLNGQKDKLKVEPKPTPTQQKNGLKLTYIFWGLLAVGLVFGTMEILMIDIGEFSSFLGEFGDIVGIVGTLFCLGIMFKGKKWIRDDSVESQEAKSKSLKATLKHSTLETAFVTSWVLVGFLAFELLVLGAGGGDYAAGEQVVESVLLAAGLASVFVAVAVGIIPGCGPQIIFVALFTQGLVPFAALIANAISQDGDALFPVLAMDRRSAIYASLINKVPALIMGLFIFWLEFYTDFGQYVQLALDSFKGIFI
ncbi:putative manganese transporter [Proteinivorax hydrogeniformans]|uniref:Manganese transporter n=1 Tax=Proteinivorax hydrogeniformans TaxID=1826727 RepID=A0AAU8HSN5_9FIRM